MIVVPVYNMLILPNANIYFQAEQFKRIAGRAVKDDKVVILMTKQDQKREEMTEESFYPIGVSGIISEISSEGVVTVTTASRVNIDIVNVNPDRTIELTISRRQDIQDLDETIQAAKLAAMKREVRTFASNFQWGEAYTRFIDQMKTINAIVCALSVWMQLSNEDRYAILAEDSISKRVDLEEKAFYECIETAKVSTDAASAQQKEYQDMYRESAIKKQIEYLQKELDEMHPEQVTDVRKFQKAIEASGMNETARTEAEKVLNRLKQEGSNSAESGMLYDYLDFVTGLSWKKQEAHFIDLEAAARILDEDHYGLKKVKKRVIQQIAVMNLKAQQSGSILCFVGAPGTGKTSIGRSIARALDREYVRVSLGGVRDEADIRGHRRTYIGAMPGRIMDGISKSGVSNPVMVLDEVDKLSASYNGDPASALLEVLDPEQNNTFTDHYMNVPYDLSDVLFICTANSLDTIPEPLLNRMEVIQFEGYTQTEKLQIARRHLLPKAMESMGIPEGQLVVSDDIINEIITDYTRESGVRGLRKRMDALCRGAAVMLASAKASGAVSGTAGAAEAAAGADTDAAVSGDQAPVVTITKDHLREELDMRPVRHEHTPGSQNPGVVTGLAWTSVGGEILYVETLFTKGKGGLTITGQLGDVMKESAQIAVSLVKAMFPESAELFEKHDLHIHVPEGAVPKDGPSAGITMTTALSSLVTGKPVCPQIAMTGEVSLRGVITPIGGLPEKLMAALRAGVKQVFIPKENEEDLKDVPEEVRAQLTIVPVEKVTDVLTATGLMAAE